MRKFVFAVSPLFLLFVGEVAAGSLVPPTALNASTASTSRIDLSWNDTNNGEGGYIVERSLASSTGFVQIAETGGNVEAHTDIGLNGGTTYYYRVRAFKKDLQSGASNVASATTQSSITQPVTPTALGAIPVTSSQINLSWQDNSSDESGFKIERSSSSLGPWGEIAAVGANSTAYSNMGLSASTTYYYRVHAFNSIDDSSYSNTANATTPGSSPTTPAPPSGLGAAAVSSSQINLSWQDNSSDESGFKIERSSSSLGPWSQIASVGANWTSYANSGLSASTTYYYRIRAYNSAGNSGYSNTANATTGSTGTTPPAAPSSLSATAVSCSQVNLSWQDNSNNEDGFRIERYLSPGPWTQIATASTNTTSFLDSGLAGSTKHYYRVSAYNTGGTSDTTTTVRVTTPECDGSDQTPPSVPTGLTAVAVSCSQINVSWTASTDDTGVVGYRVFRNGAFFTQVSGTSLSHSNLQGSTPYSYQVTAVDAAGNESGTSNSDTATTEACADETPPSVPGNVRTSSVTCNEVVLLWNASNDADSGIAGYRVFRDGALVSGASLVAGTTWTDTDVDENSVYAYRVSAVDNAGNGSSLSTALTTNTPACTDNDPPVANAGADQTVEVSELASFSGSGSSDPDGSIETYHWNFGDGWTASGMTAAHSYGQSGTYTVTLTVTDDRGADGTDTAVVTVAEPPSDGTWPKGLGGMDADFGQAVGVDSSGNVIAVGRFSGTANFGGSPLTSNGSSDLYVAKYSSAGAHLWSRHFGGSGSEVVRDMAVDNNGNITVTGYFTGTTNLGTGYLSSAGSIDIFVARYSSSGTALWAKRFGASSDDVGYGVAVDASGNVYVTGFFTGTVSFGGDALTSASGGFDIFVAKLLAANGSHAWSKKFLNNSGDVGYSLAVDGGNVLLTGSFMGLINLGGGTLTSAGANDVFLTKLSTQDGSHQWSKRFGGTGDDIAYDVAVDGSGNAAITGFFTNSASFGGNTLSSAGVQDVFLAQYSSTGQHRWSKALGGGSTDVANSVAFDSAGSVHLSGYFQHIANFGGSNLTSAGFQDIVVAKYSSNGQHLRSEGYGGLNSDLGTGIAVDATGHAVVTGYFNDVADFGTDTLISQGSADVFLLKMAP